MEREGTHHLPRIRQGKSYRIDYPGIHLTRGGRSEHPQRVAHRRFSISQVQHLKTGLPVIKRDLLFDRRNDRVRPSAVDLHTLLPHDKVIDQPKLPVPDSPAAYRGSVAFRIAGRGRPPAEPTVRPIRGAPRPR